MAGSKGGGKGSPHGRTRLPLLRRQTLGWSAGGVPYQEVVKHCPSAFWHRPYVRLPELWVGPQGLAAMQRPFCLGRHCAPPHARAAAPASRPLPRVRPMLQSRAAARPRPSTARPAALLHWAALLEAQNGQRSGSGAARSLRCRGVQRCAIRGADGARRRSAPPAPGTPPACSPATAPPLVTPPSSPGASVMLPALRNSERRRIAGGGMLLARLLNNHYHCNLT